MKIDRKELLNRLLCIEPGVLKKDGIQQSDCIILRNGRFYSFHPEIACSILSGLDVSWTAAVRAEKLIQCLKARTTKEVDVSLVEGKLCIRGNGTTTIPTEPDVVLPIDSVEIPKAWTRLDQRFSESVNLLVECTTTTKEFLNECVHLHPDYMEACDQIQIVRCLIPGIVKVPKLIRGSSLKHLRQLGMTKVAETENWIHFKNPLGLRLSIIKYGIEQSYPDLTETVEKRGVKIKFPPALDRSINRAMIFSDESAGMSVVIRDGKMLIDGSSVEGGHSERIETKAPDIQFRIFPKMLLEVVKNYDRCEITDSTLTVRSRDFVYATVVERL